MLNKNERKLFKEDAHIILTEKEVQLLDLFLIKNKPISKDDILLIIDIELDKLFKRINSLGFIIELTKKAKKFVADKGYDE